MTWNALLVFAKRPEPGQAKTRLTPPLTAEEAATLYECFLLDTLARVRRVPGVRLVLAYMPASDEAYFSQLAPDVERVAQVGYDLGTRLDNTTTDYLTQGYDKVVVVGSDSPTLPIDYLVAAFEALTGEVDVVIGPCEDGGYYLIGLKRPAPRLFCEVQMSTSRTFADTLDMAAKEKLRVHMLPRWYDVDDAFSLAHLQTELSRSPSVSASHTRRFLAEYLP
jgi:rSAM/selenodomain-associated transferase 1